MGNYSRLRGVVGGRRVRAPAPTADFTANNTAPDNNTVVTFTDASAGSPTAWSWSFGDGGTSTLQNPTHTYATPGTYTVSLTASTSGGSNTKTRTNYIVVGDFLAGINGFYLDWSAERAYTNTGATTPAAADGDLVAALFDPGEDTVNATQATSGNRPTFVTVGGKPAVKFLASASKTIGASGFLGPSQNTALTYYLVCEYHGRAGPRVMVGGNSTNLFHAGDLNAGTALRMDVFTNNNGNRYAEYTGKNRLVVCFTYDGATKRVIVRGYSGVSDEETDSSMAVSLAVSGGGFTLGDLSQGGGFACNFFFHELAVYFAAHDSTARTAVLDFLRTKWLTEPAAGTHAAGAGTRQLTADGDSLTVGQGLSAGQDWVSLLATDLGGSYTCTNKAVGGQTQGEMNSDAETEIDVLFSASNTDNIYVNWGGTNDLYYGIDAATTYRRIREGCLRRRAKGYKVIVCNTINRQDGGGAAGFATRATALNALLLAHWTEFADAHIDLASDFPDATDTNKFQGDLVHITAAGQITVKGRIKTAVQSLAA